MLRLPERYVSEMVSHALQEAPNERCGILGGKDGQALKMYPMTNVEHSPYRYSMDSKELYQTYREIDDNGWEIMVIYHSPSHTEAYPSETDRRLAAWPDAHYVIVSLEDKVEPVVRAYRITDGEVTEEELRVV